MKNLSHNINTISIFLVGIVFIIAFWGIYFNSQFLWLFFDGMHSTVITSKQNHWEMIYTNNKDNDLGIPCDLTYPVFFSWVTQIDFGKEIFSNLWTQKKDTISPEKCEWKLSRPIFQDGWWWYSSGTLTLIFSWWVRSVLEIDRAFDVNGKLLANDHNFHVDLSRLTQDLSLYFGKNIADTFYSKIDGITLWDRVVAPNDHERFLFLRDSPVISWPSDWRVIRFVRSKDHWRIEIPSNVTRRYKVQVSVGAIKIPDKILSLTFDDGPSNAYTPLILDILKNHNIKASFCIVWSQALRYPELVRRIYQEWHEICNHSVSHPNFTWIPLIQAQTEIVQNETIINDILWMSMIVPFVRPPYGAISPEMEKQMNTPFALWSVDTLDWKDQRPKSIMKRASVAQSGDIVLFHDIHPGVIKMLDQYISQYRSEWYSFVTLSQLMGSWWISDISGQSLFKFNRVKYLHNQK